MNFFNKNPVVRLVFFFTYLVTAVWIVIENFAWLNIFVGLLMLFGCYITLVKSKLIRDERANSINDLNFDILSIAVIVSLAVELFKFIFAR